MVAIRFGCRSGFHDKRDRVSIPVGRNLFIFKTFQSRSMVINFVFKKINK